MQGDMQTIYDDKKARTALESVAAGGGPSARVCRAILAHADEAWGGRVSCAINDVRDGEMPTRVAVLAGTDARRVAAFVDRLPATFGYRPMTAAEEVEAEANRLREIAARAAAMAAEGRRIGDPATTTPTPVDRGGNYSPATGDGLRDAATWAREAYACGDSWSDE